MRKEGGSGHPREGIVRRAWRMITPCRHDGLRTPLRTIAPGIEVWRCERCLAHVLYTDAFAFEPVEPGRLRRFTQHNRSDTQVR